MNKLFGDPGVSYEAYESLMRENERLREALKFYTNKDDDGKIARNALRNKEPIDVR